MPRANTKLNIPTRGEMFDSGGNLTKQWLDFFTSLAAQAESSDAELLAAVNGNSQRIDPRNSLTLNGVRASLIFDRGLAARFRIIQLLATPAVQFVANAYYDAGSGTWKFVDALQSASQISQDTGYVRFAWGKAIAGVLSWIFGFNFDMVNQRLGVGKFTPAYAGDFVGDVNVAADVDVDHPAPGVYRHAGTPGLLSSTVALARLSPSGAAGSATVSGGIVTAYAAPTSASEFSGTIALAKLTGGGTDGSITVVNAAVTAYTAPT